MRTQDPIVVPVPDDFSTELEPDFAVTRESTMSYTIDNPWPSDILMVGEVSDSTLTYDLHTKANLYSAAGIAEYWVLDISGRQLHVHRIPSMEGYREIHMYTESEFVTSLARPNDSVLVSSFLPPPVD